MSIDRTRRVLMPNECESILESNEENQNNELQLNIQNDRILSRKMHLVNEAINNIGLTSYHVKLFFLNGFGYAVDSLLLLLNALTQSQIAMQFQPAVSKAQTMAVGVGLLFGALFWGLGADIIGRRYAFNITLFWCSIFAVVTGASPNFLLVCIFISLMAFGSGGNLILDTAVYLEFLPGKYQWSLTFMAVWWGVGQMIAGLAAWPLMANFSCEKSIDCTNDNNSGWRYSFYALGSFVFILSILRIFVIRLKESPKWLLSQNKDDEVVRIIEEIALIGGKTCPLTVDQLRTIGTVVQANNAKTYSPSIILYHIKGLFATKKLGYSMMLNILSWTTIGLAYPLYNVFLPEYLKSRGAQTGDDSISTTYRNFAIVNACTIIGPIIAGALVEIRRLGRRYTMVIGALLTMGSLFAYTQVRTSVQNLVFSCIVSVCLNIYYATLYAYTPEVIPSAHRGTGNAITVACNRIMIIVAGIIGTYVNLETSLPIYICAGSFALLAVFSFLFPFEPHGQTSV